VILIKDLADEEIQQEWRAAVTHAGFDQGEVALWLGEEKPEEIRDVGAQCFAPHLDPDPPYLFSGEQWDEAVSEPFRDRHRIVLQAAYELPGDLDGSCLRALVGALLRHELEHARQTARWGPDLFNVYQQFILRAMWKTFGGSISGEYLNLVPIELDANAAAAVYLREQHPGAIDQLRGTDWANLCRNVRGPQPRGTLMQRMIAFLSIFRDAIEELEDGSPVGNRLRLYHAEAAEMWERLVAEAEPSRP
jgi:hypothetical protein